MQIYADCNCILREKYFVPFIYDTFHHCTVHLFVPDDYYEFENQSVGYSFETAENHQHDTECALSHLLVLPDQPGHFPERQNSDERRTG